MLARRAGDGQHIVERHGNVGDDDLPGSLQKGTLFERGGRGSMRTFAGSSPFERKRFWPGCPQLTYIFQHTHSRSLRAADEEQSDNLRSWVVAAAKPMRRTVAAMADQDRLAR